MESRLDVVMNDLNQSKMRGHVLEAVVRRAHGHAEANGMLGEEWNWMLNSGSGGSGGGNGGGYTGGEGGSISMSGIVVSLNYVGMLTRIVGAFQDRQYIHRLNI